MNLPQFFWAPSQTEDFRLGSTEMSKRSDGRARGKYTLEFKLRGGALGQGWSIRRCDRKGAGHTAEPDAGQLGTLE